MAREFTQVALRAFTLADLFQATFKEPLGGAIPYRVELTAPDGPSTSGGKQALQHIKLIPSAGGVTIVAGSANSSEGVAELRSFEYLAGLHAQRFRGASIPLDANHYRELVKRMQVFFTDQRLSVTTINAATGNFPAVPKPSSSSSLASIGALVALLALIGAGLYYYLTVRR